jgi:hypothetical protein
MFGISFQVILSLNHSDSAAASFCLLRIHMLKIPPASSAQRMPAARTSGLASAMAKLQIPASTKTVGITGESEVAVSSQRRGSCFADPRHP